MKSYHKRTKKGLKAMNEYWLRVGISFIAAILLGFTMGMVYFTQSGISFSIAILLGIIIGMTTLIK